MVLSPEDSEDISIFAESSFGHTVVDEEIKTQRGKIDLSKTHSKTHDLKSACYAAISIVLPLTLCCQPPTHLSFVFFLVCAAKLCLSRASSRCFISSVHRTRAAKSLLTLQGTELLQWGLYKPWHSRVFTTTLSFPFPSLHSQMTIGSSQHQASSFK